MSSGGSQAAHPQPQLGPLMNSINIQSSWGDDILLYNQNDAHRRRTLQVMPMGSSLPDMIRSDSMMWSIYHHSLNYIRSFFDILSSKQSSITSNNLFASRFLSSLNDTVFIPSYYSNKQSNILKELGRNRAAVTKATARQTGVQVIMRDTSGAGWTNPVSPYDGVSFQISDATKTMLIAHGTLQDGVASGFCSYCLDDGSYHFRVTGLLGAGGGAEGAQWVFCGVRGGHGEELSFHLQQGQCYPDALVTASALCKKSSETIVTLRGDLSITVEAFTGVVDDQVTQVVGKAISMCVYGLPSGSVTVTASDGASAPIKKSGKAASEQSFYLAILAQIKTEENYGVDGSNYVDDVGLATIVAADLTAAASSGSLARRIREIAKRERCSTLSRVTSVSVTSIAINDIIHNGAKDMEIVQSSSTSLSSSFERISGSTIVQNVRRVRASNGLLFITVMMVGLFSLIGIIAHVITCTRRMKQFPSSFSSVVRRSSVDDPTMDFSTSSTSALRLDMSIRADLVDPSDAEVPVPNVLQSLSPNRWPVKL